MPHPGGIISDVNEDVVAGLVPFLLESDHTFDLHQTQKEKDGSGSNFVAHIFCLTICSGPIHPPMHGAYLSLQHASIIRYSRLIKFAYS